MDDRRTPCIEATIKRRQFIRTAAAGTIVTALGGASFALADDLTARARNQKRPDGRPRLPPGQRVLQRLKPMGGEPGDPSPNAFRLRVHGLVERPYTLSFADLLEMRQVERELDVHCVTGWTVLGARWTGVRIRDLAKRARVEKEARYVIFEAAHRYTANVPLRDAVATSSMVAHKLEGRPLPRKHGAPVRAVVPDLYFWKSAKWLTGIKFVRRDEPGYWEVRGYHNRGDPWREERYG